MSAGYKDYLNEIWRLTHKMTSDRANTVQQVGLQTQLVPEHSVIVSSAPGPHSVDLLHLQTSCQTKLK